MNRHLSSEQLSGWFVGERGPEAERHLLDCRACRAEVARLEEVLAEFRGSVRSWSEQQLITGADRRRAWPPADNPAWAVAALAIVLIASFSLAWPVRGHRYAAAAASDAALLSEVDAQVSRTVPGPMDPLARLVSWGINPEPRLIQKQ